MSADPRPQPGDDLPRGPLRWMACHRVAPNLLMLLLLVGGLFMSLQVQKQVFPDFQLDTVTVTVSYPGATPEEVERAVVLAVEEAVSGLDGIDEVRSTAAEGSGTVTLELMSNADRQVVYQDVQQAVSRITTLPAEAEEPEIELSSHRRDVMDLQVHGDVDPWTLRQAAEKVRDRILDSDGVTQAELDEPRGLQIHIDVPERALRAHGLTRAEIARTVRDYARDRAGGSVETRGGEILLRVTERRQWAKEFADIPVLSGAAGAPVRLGDIADIREGFEDINRSALFNGQPAVGMEVFRVEDETPITVSDAVREAMPRVLADLPEGIDVSIEDDNSEIYSQRVNLLLKNGFLGLLLVLVLLSIFLEFKLAFWVTVGIPTAFLGAFLFLPALDVSINMVSMFAFIIALGIVVDDAIVAGENIYEYRQRGMGLIAAAVQGARDIAVPISFSILTNIVAFTPLLFIPGTFGQIWAVIPAVVISVFVLSWVEALFILPAHLAHTRDRRGTRWGEALHRRQQAFSDGFRNFIEQRYRPFLALTVRWRYVTAAAAFAILLVTLAFPLSGRMGFILMPTVEGDRADATAELPVGSPMHRAEAVRDRMVEGANQVIEDHGGDELATGVYATINENKVRMSVYLRPGTDREISTGEVVRQWREAAGTIPGTESVRYESDRGGPGGGPAVSAELSHTDIDTLERASEALAEELEALGPTADVDDGYTPGKRQFDLEITEAARGLGLTAADIGDQVRHAFYGAEALRVLRGRNEVRILVRRPEGERRRIEDVENLLIRTPDDGWVPLREVAEIDRGRGYTTIERRDHRRTVTVTSDVDPEGETARVLETLRNETLPRLTDDYPGLTWSFEGRQASMRDAINSFFISVTLALLLIYGLLAIPFRSYIQPMVIMAAIPFGVVGAILGHLLMGYNLSMISIMGVIALGGVVVNSALVMIDYANARRAEGSTAIDAVVEAGARRFRPIMLTTLTTFGGLAPMIFETSRQARFMIPMAISLGYGILFATAILLLLIPSLYAIVEDLRRVVGLQDD
ncbi:MAG: efflux RND transporter permease subunit [Thiohalospira sp.]